MPFYKRNLPHLQFNGGEYFVTFRLSGSLPIHIVKELKALREQNQKAINNDSEGKRRSEIERKIFVKYESHLDNNKSGPHWLKRSDIAGVIKDSIHFRDSKIIDLYSYCVMTNHVHMVFRHLNLINEFEQKSLSYNKITGKFPVTTILGNLKKYTAKHCNKILNRSGSFWQAENFDRLIRDDSELENCILYTLNNPVKANLVSDWRKWAHSFCKQEFLDSV